MQISLANSHLCEHVYSGKTCSTYSNCIHWSMTAFEGRRSIKDAWRFCRILKLKIRIDGITKVDRYYFVHSKPETAVLSRTVWKSFRLLMGSALFLGELLQSQPGPMNNAQACSSLRQLPWKVLCTASFLKYKHLEAFRNGYLECCWRTWALRSHICTSTDIETRN